MIDWFSLSNELAHHVKRKQLCRLLKDDAACWYVVALWGWCSKHCINGVFAGETASEFIEDAAGWPGKPGDFFRAAVAAGFLEQLPDGNVEVHDWWEWNGKAIDKAEREASAKRAKRDASRGPDGRYYERHNRATASPRRENGAKTAPHDGAPRRENGAPARTAAASTDVDVDVDVLKTTELRSVGAAAHAARPELAGGEQPTTTDPPAPKSRKPSAQEAFYAWAQGERAKAFPQAPADEVFDARKLNPLLKPVLDRHGKLGAEGGWLAYLQSQAARDASPPAPLRLFVSLHGRFVSEAQRKATAPQTPPGTRGGWVRAEDTDYSQPTRVRGLE